MPAPSAIPYYLQRPAAPPDPWMPPGAAPPPTAAPPNGAPPNPSPYPMPAPGVGAAPPGMPGPGMGPPGAGAPFPGQEPTPPPDQVAYWTTVMRGYLDQVTKPQPPISPQPLSVWQKGAYMMNPSMRPQIFEMSQAPYRAALAHRAQEMEAGRNAATLAGSMLHVASSDVNRQYIRDRYQQTQDYQAAKMAADAGDTSFDFSRFPELAGIAKTNRRDRSTKDLQGYLAKRRDDQQQLEARVGQMTSNPNLQWMMNPPADQQGAPQYKSMSDELLNSASTQLADTKKEIAVLQRLDADSWEMLNAPDMTPELRARAVELLYQKYYGTPARQEVPYNLADPSQSPNAPQPPLYW